MERDDGAWSLKRATMDFYLGTCGILFEYRTNGIDQGGSLSSGKYKIAERRREERRSDRIEWIFMLRREKILGSRQDFLDYFHQVVPGNWFN